MIIKKSREYYQRKASINKKANQSTAYKIQVYNNNRVDELVKRYNEGEAYTGTPESVLYAELAMLNKPEVYKHYNHIIHSKFTSNDNIDNLNVKNKANRELDRIVSAEVERVSKNLQYVEQVLHKYNIPQKQYEEFKAKQEQSSIANRQQILKEVAVKANDLLVSDGLNIPNTYTYRNIETTAENLLRQSQMGSKHEEILAINSNYKSQGKDEIYTGKEWIWTGRGETTRHRSNHLQKRQLKEPFVIVNDKTLHIDELMYPCDPAGSFSNAFICYCEVQYLTGDARDYQNLGSLSLTDTKFKVNAPALKTPKFIGAKQFKKQFNKPSPVVTAEPVAKEFDQARFDELKTYEEVADFFGLEYEGKTIRFDSIDGEAISFYDPNHNCRIQVFVDEKNKPPSLDLTNSGKANVNLKDFIKAYDDAPINLKRASGEINAMKGNKYSPGGDCGDHKITIYESTFEYANKIMKTRKMGEYGKGNILETNLWHEMTHALDNLFIKEGEFNNMGNVAVDLRERWIKATEKDYEYQKQNGIERQDSTSYGEEKINEDFAEFGGAVSSMLNNKANGYVQMNAYGVKTPQGRRKRFISETLKNNPNRAKLMEELLTDITQVSDKRKIKETDKLRKMYQESDMVHLL